jgi:hypothetical protein
MPLTERQQRDWDEEVRMARECVFPHYASKIIIAVDEEMQRLRNIVDAAQQYVHGYWAVINGFNAALIVDPQLLRQRDEAWERLQCLVGPQTSGVERGGSLNVTTPDGNLARG